MGIVLVLLGTIILAAQIVVAKLILDFGVTPLGFIGWRAIVCLPVVVLALSRSKGAVPLRAKLWAACAGMLVDFVSPLCNLEAILRISTTLNSVFYSCHPIFTALLTFALFRRKLTLAQVFCLLLVQVGLVLATGTTATFELSEAVFWGIALSLAAAIFTASYTVINKAFSEISDINFVAYALVGSTISAVLALPFFGPQELFIPAMEPMALLLFAGISHIATLLLISAGLKHIGATMAAMVVATEPIFVSIFAILLLGEVFTLSLASGIFLVVTSIIAFNSSYFSQGNDAKEHRKIAHKT